MRMKGLPAPRVTSLLKRRRNWELEDRDTVGDIDIPARVRVAAVEGWKILQKPIQPHKVEGRRLDIAPRDD